MSSPCRIAPSFAYKRWLTGDKMLSPALEVTESSPSPAHRALTMLTAAAIEAGRAGAGSMHRVTGAAVLALAFLAAGFPIGTRSTGCRDKQRCHQDLGSRDEQSQHTAQLRVWRDAQQLAQCVS